MHTCGGGNLEPKIIEPINTDKDGNPTPHTAIIEIYKNKHVQKMVESGKIDPTKVQYLDTYNQIAREDVASTISTRTDANNDCYVTEPQILTQRRTEVGRELRKQGVDVFANKELVPREDGVSGTLTTVQKDNLLIEPQVIGSMQENAYRGSTDGVAPCINAAMGMGGGHVPMVTEPKIISYSRDEKGKVVDYHTKDVANTLHCSSCNFGSQGQYVQEAVSELKQIAQSGRSCEVDVEVDVNVLADGSLRPYNPNSPKKDAISEFCTDYDGSVGSTQIAARPNNVYGAATQYKIRKLTERECFRLMNVSEEDIDKIQAAGISKSAQYRLAGNSIVVSCLYHIFRELFVDKTKPQQLTLF